VILTAAVCSTISVVVFAKQSKDKINKEQGAKTIEVPASAACETEVHRLAGYKYIKPLLYNTIACESGKYNSLKTKIDAVINQYKLAGDLDRVSVYLKILSNSEFIAINENELYHPASLIKLPMLIAFLQMEEQHPGTLNKKLTFHLPKGMPNQTYVTKQIEPEKSYTIKQLLKYMIAYSDNNATYLLNINVDLNVFKKIFSDFGLVVPDIHDKNYQISAKDYSLFLNIVYNAGYLTIAHSEFVADLLNESNFEVGMQSGLPSNTNIIHKFGEWGESENPDMHQLSESGIIYLDNCHYLLTIMTQGKDVNNLPPVLSDISKTIYDYLNVDKSSI
jgi:beta-lactamase class A